MSWSKSSSCGSALEDLPLSSPNVKGRWSVIVVHSWPKTSSHHSRPTPRASKPNLQRSKPASPPRRLKATNSLRKKTHLLLSVVRPRRCWKVVLRRRQRLRPLLKCVENFAHFATPSNWARAKCSVFRHDSNRSRIKTRVSSQRSTDCSQSSQRSRTHCSIQKRGLSPRKPVVQTLKSPATKRNVFAPKPRPCGQDGTLASRLFRRQWRRHVHAWVPNTSRRSMVSSAPSLIW